MEPLLLVAVSGLTIGFLGSVHCLGMCGPIALTLPVFRLSGIKRVRSIAFYNVGRAITYAILGMLFGLVGAGFHLFGWQQWLSIVAGVLILLILLSGRFSLSGARVLQPFTNRVKSRLGVFLKEDKTAGSYLGIGLLNGLLPCGLVYVAIAASIATGSVGGGALLMFSFGLGTIPMMATTMAFGRYISVHNRQRINKVAPYVIGAMAVLLILRGMNLGIPFISPKDVSTEEMCAVDCCEH
jgi:uncharacterized protein